MKFKIFRASLVTAICVLLFGCDYDFALTTKPTHKVDERLLGDWVAVGKEDSSEEMMHVRNFDGFSYAVSMDKDIYRVYHSDFAATPFLSVQDLNPGNRKYLYFVWSLSVDGSQLSLKGVDTKVIPEGTKSAAEIRRLIKQQLANPKLFRDEVRFARKKSVN